MWIANQYENEVVNLDQYRYVVVRQEEVLAYDEQTCRLLGRYKSEQRAKEVFGLLISNMFDDANNWNCYHMPRE